MAKQRQSAGKGIASPSEQADGQIGIHVQESDSERGSGTESLGTQTDTDGKTWPEIEAKLASIESSQNGITLLCVPSPNQALWTGVYGTASIHVGDWYAVTSDGVKHAL